MAVVQLPGYRVEVSGGVEAEIGVLGKILPQQAVRVLVAASLPRNVRITEEDVDLAVHAEADMLGHLLALVPGQRASEFPGKLGDLPCQSHAHVFRHTAVGQV